ncbi:hypothetical protein [Bacteroides heparinolyticus]|uniref:hypothetical protein n=2 Tax=Prevotella heparinolytica TaxID=28113 RepID=UPI0035A09838
MDIQGIIPSDWYKDIIFRVSIKKNTNLSCDAHKFFLHHYPFFLYQHSHHPQTDIANTYAEAVKLRTHVNILLKSLSERRTPARRGCGQGYLSDTEKRVVPHRGTMSSTPRNEALLGVGETPRPQFWKICNNK